MTDFGNVVCGGCACLCDDLRVQVTNNEITGLEPSCPLGNQWFSSRAQPVQNPHAVHDQPVGYQMAVDEAVELLARADYPLVYGLSRSATPGQRAAVELGELLGGVVDTTASLCHGPSIMALQELGEVTCTLGEIRNRADLVVFWGCNPARSHPRHAERYSVHPAGRFTRQGRAGRTVVLVGDSSQIGSVELDDQGTQPDMRIGIEPGTDFEVLSCMLAALNGQAPPELPDELAELVERMKSCRYGVVFFGLGLADPGIWSGQPSRGTGHMNVSALLRLVAELNAFTRFTARRMRLQGDVSGADNVLCWQTAYPFAVDFSRGFPRYNPGEFTANELLERADVDLMLAVGSETFGYFSPQAQEHLRRIPTIVLENAGDVPPSETNVRITTATYGIHAEGTAYRMDNVPLALRPMLHSSLPTDERVLKDFSGRLAR